MKTKKDLITAVVLAEGKKKSVSRAQVAEIVKIISDMAKADSKVIALLLK